MEAEPDKTLRGNGETGGHTERVIQRPVCARIIRIIGQLPHPADI
jgi:hypothetical protein